MGLLSWMLFGAIAGWIASLVTGRNKRMGCLANMFVGIIGAMLGGFIARFFGGGPVTGFNMSSFVVAVIGAIILLGITGWWQQHEA